MDMLLTIKEKLKSIEANKIFIFGSYAYGNPSRDSDIDICIVKETKNKAKVKKEVRKLLRDINYPKDIIIATPKEFEFYKNEAGSVFKDINDKGVLVWSS